MRSQRPGSTSRLFPVILLGLGVLALATWAIVGKFRLDRDARLVYKASRPLVTENDAPALPRLAPLEPVQFPPPVSCGLVVLERPLPPVAWRCGAPLPARSPPVL